jgi:hypothetical protein
MSQTITVILRKTHNIEYIAQLTEVGPHDFKKKVQAAIQCMIEDDDDNEAEYQFAFVTLDG